jgi:hypothetical protein
MIEQAPILITGIPRSGTSIIAGVIKQCGAFIGNVSRRGMYENDNIREHLVKQYFYRIGADPRGQFPIPSTINLPIPGDWRERVEKIITMEGYHELNGGYWVYKGTGMSLIWPVWHNAFPNAKWIIVRRRTGDVIQSCLKTTYMKAYNDIDGWKGWVHQYERKFVEMMEAGVNCKIIWPERMVTGDFQQMKEVLEWVGLQWTDEIKDFIDPLLWNSRMKINKGG